MCEALDVEHDSSCVFDVDQVQIAVGGGVDRIAAPQCVGSRNSIGPVDARQSQDDRPRAERMIVNRLLRGEARLASFTQRPARRLFIDPVAVGIAVDAGGGDVEEAGDRDREQEQILPGCLLSAVS